MRLQAYACQFSLPSHRITENMSTRIAVAEQQNAVGDVRLLTPLTETAAQQKSLRLEWQLAANDS